MIKNIIAICLLISLIGCAKDGTVGPAGQKGDTGSSGPQGVSGTNGSSCSVTSVSVSSVAPNGGSLISCTNGTSNLVLNGVPGVQGQPGTSATLADPVLLCPGTTVYPTTFIEVAFCVNNRLYGVYSANGGFMTEITQGSWSSNAIGSSCNFTVGPNCQVSH